LGIRSPLRECGFTKEDIRQLAKRFALPNWQQPANACLASRFPMEHLLPRKLSLK